MIEPNELDCDQKEIPEELLNESENDDHTQEPNKKKQWDPNSAGLQEAVQIIKGDVTINLASSYIRTDSLCDLAYTLYSNMQSNTKSNTGDYIQ